MSDDDFRQNLHMNLIPQLCQTFLLPALFMGAMQCCDAPIDVPQRYLFLGDTSFGENYLESEEVNVLHQYSYSYPLENFEVFLSEMDEVIVNLETPITDLREPAFDDKNYTHWSTEMALKTLSEFNVKNFALANNHSMDFEQEGLHDTLISLNNLDLNTFGAGLNSKEAAKPLIIETEDKAILIISAFEDLSIYDENFHFYSEEEGSESSGVYRLNLEEISNQIEELENEYEDPFIILFPHWGTNYEMEDAAQKAMAYSFISEGVDLIIGHGAHIAQGIESKDEKWILHNLGNFVFNSPGRFEETETEPYSYMTELLVYKEETRLRIYPIFTDNKITTYQSRFVSEQEWEEIQSTIPEEWSLGQDEHGYFAEVSLI
jgi:cyanophycin synthetase